MEFKILLLLFISFDCFNFKSIEKNEVIEYNLNIDMDRKIYIIKSNQTSKFVNSNDSYIYFIELPKGIIAVDEKNKTFKDLIFLSELNQSIIIDIEDESNKDIEILVTSIFNNLKILYLNNIFSKISLINNQNIIIIVYVDQNENQIISLGSLENSLLFYYYKYEYNKISPKEFSPINKTYFKKYENDILLLNKNSIYIFYADLYKLDYTINMLDIFISPEQVDKDFQVNNDIIYLKTSEDYYNITFDKVNNLDIIFKLSRKTNDSEIINSNGEIILDSKHLYYELNEENIKNGIQIKVKNTDCLIELLFSSKDNTEILESYSIENYKLTKRYTIIKIPKNKCKYVFSFTSNNKKKLTTFYFGLNNKISKNNYFYNWKNISIPYIKNQNKINYTAPYLYSNEMEENEFQILEIILDDIQLENDIFLTYSPISYFKYLYKDITEEKCEYIIGNISSYLQKFYIYKDIAKKPPKVENLENYHHNPIDLVNSLNNINIKNKTYIGLFQEINKILRAVRDDHLDIVLTNIEDKLNLPSVSFCIPFSFYIEKGNNDIPILKMKAYNECLDFYSNKNYILKYLKDHDDIPLKSINNTDPFDYIQNFGQIQNLKNRHAQFTENLNKITTSRIDFNPMDLSDLVNINYEYENGDIINMDYFFVAPSNFEDINQKGFEEFLLSLNKNQSNFRLIPNIFEAKKLFQQKKGILFEENTSEVKWDIETKDKILKCKVDEVYKYNIFLQTGFLFSSLNDVIDVMVKCSELFYSNNYKIIGIENLNGGGTALLYPIWHQLIQQKILDRNFRAMLNNDDILKYVKENYLFSEFSNYETCKFYNSEKEMGEIIDDYGYSEDFKINIEHNRTKIYDFLDKTWRKRLESIRKKNFENKINLKNPTDIIIYTDSYCFSACSGLVKAFQNSGGAIIVGFNGNPTIKGITEFDSSQSSSSVHKFMTKENFELENLGYHVYGVTYSESFDDSYKDPNPIPREYTINIVDKRVDIYGPYTDDLYSTFISKAENIFEEFKNYCNKNNKKLILNDDNCILNDHKKGGHPCKDDGTWNKEICKAYYCDLGYYYDSNKDQCLLDVCNNNENEININVDIDEFNETTEYIVEPNHELIFHLNNDSYFYFFEANIENLFMTYHDTQNKRNNINLCMLDFKKENIFDYEVNVNYYKTLKQNTTIKLTIIKKTPNISIGDNIFGQKQYISSYVTKVNEQQLIYSFQSTREHIICTFSFNKDIKYYFSEYNFDISPKEIINIAPNIFKEIPKNIITTIKENKTTIFIYKFPNNIISSIYLYLSPKNLDENIKIEKERFLYLTQQNFDYNLYFNLNSKNFLIRLDYLTPDAEIIIIDNNNTILNKNSKYYLVDKNTKKISLRLNNNNPALIEFLYEFNDYINLDNKQKEFNLTDGYHLLKYKKSDKIKSIKMNLKSENNLTLFIYGNIGKENYFGVLPIEEAYNLNFISTEFLIPNEKLLDDETFNILFSIKDNVTLNIEINKDENNDYEDEGFPIWVLILIIFLRISIIVIIFVIIIKKNKCKNNNQNINEKGPLLDSDEN